MADLNATLRVGNKWPILARVQQQKLEYFINLKK
jgi:hypothetical protein